MRCFLAALWMALGLLAQPLAHANEAAPLAEDPVIERRLNRIAEELRCLVCQNESLAASRADLALDLRRELRELIRAGRSDAEIRDFMVARYGDFVLYRPPVKPTTWLLWAGPFGLMVGGVLALLLHLHRRRARVPGAAPLTDEERQRAEALLVDEAPPPRAESAPPNQPR